MNREILFRGKSIGAGVWLYGNLQVPGKPGVEYFMWDEELYQRAVYSETIGQYTGLKDKGGKKIFEGDVVIIGEKLKAKVIYYDGAFRMQSEFSPTPIDTTDMGYMMREFSVRVIGNIHDNPELIK